MVIKTALTIEFLQSRKLLKLEHIMIIKIYI